MDALEDTWEAIDRASERAITEGMKTGFRNTASHVAVLRAEAALRVYDLLDYKLTLGVDEKKESTMRAKVRDTTLALLKSVKCDKLVSWPLCSLWCGRRY